MWDLEGHFKDIGFCLEGSGKPLQDFKQSSNMI